MELDYHSLKVKPAQIIIYLMERFAGTNKNINRCLNIEGAKNRIQRMLEIKILHE